MNATTIGIDLAKDVFEIAISDRPGRVRERRRLTRRQFALFVEGLDTGATVVMEACSSAHYWGRRCAARGATVRLLPAQHVRPYVARNKTDQADAAALLEAHRCAAIHVVPIKTIEQQSLQGLHRIRQQWQTTRTARINAVRGLLREYGIVVRTSAALLTRGVTALLEDPDSAVPPLLRPPLRALVDEIRQLEAAIKDIDAQLRHVLRTHPVAKRLHDVPGIGPITATALVASVPHIAAFRTGRHFASWLGLTPREHSSADRRHLGRISKRGDRYLRMLLVHGARAVVRAASIREARQCLTRLDTWALALAARRGRKRATVAVANKLARVVWAVWHRDRPFTVDATAAI